MWSKFDDQFYLNPKNAKISRDEQDLYIAGIIYCNGQLTDGFIPASVLIMLCCWAKIDFQANAQANAQALARQLVEHNFWEDAPGGYQVHDFLEWNISREEALAMKEARSQAGKLGGKRSAAKREAIAQANASAHAQAKSKQNPTQSPIPIQSLKEIAPKGARKSTKDERTDHPAIKVIKTVTGRLPSKATYDIVINRLGDTPDTDKLAACFEEWSLRGHNPTNLSGILDWYCSGIPKLNGNGKRQPVDKPMIPAEVYE